MDKKRNNRNAGRKLGSKNKINQDLKKEFTSIFLKKIEPSLKNFYTMDNEKRVRLLIDMLPYVLPKGNLTYEESKIQNILIEKSLPFYRNFQSYLNHIPPDKKAQILLNLVKQLNPTSTQQEKILNALK